jgi:Zn-dependent protease
MNFDWQRILVSLPGIIIGLTLHEYCHALASYKLGDQTAREMGRLSFNPLKHIDPIGFLFIIVAGFGWAKPVQFRPENLRRPRLYKAVIAAAGPLSNLVLALLFTALIRGMMAYAVASPFTMDSFAAQIFLTLLEVLLYAVMINLGLFVFNLLPIPPLDGSHIVFSGLNLRPETEHTIMKIGAICCSLF